MKGSLNRLKMRFHRVPIALLPIFCHLKVLKTFQKIYQLESINLIQLNLNNLLTNFHLNFLK